MAPKRILVITTHVAPSVQCGRQATQKFCKYFPRFGWEPRILTYDLREGIDLRLLDELPEGLAIDRLPMPRVLDGMVHIGKRMLGRRNGSQPEAISRNGSQPEVSIGNVPAVNSNGNRRRGLLFGLSEAISRLKRGLDRSVMIPDSEMLSIPFLAARAVRLIRQWRPRAVLVIVPGFSPFVAAGIAQRVTGVPLVVEYMDAWNGDLMRLWVPPWRQSLEMRLERWCLKHCAAVVGPSLPYLDHVQGIARSAGHSVPGQTVPSGFDPEDFPPPAAPAVRERRLEILHAGRVFKGRRTEVLLTALGEMRAQGQLTDDDLGLTFLGIVEPSHRQAMDALIDQYHLKKIVSFRPWVPWNECLRVQASASCLLVLGHEGPLAAGMLTMKLFEYAGAGRPVLALVPPGDARQFVERSGIGRAAAMSNKEEIKTALGGLLADWKQGRSISQPRDEYLRQFHWPEVTGRLAQFLDQVVGAGHNGRVGASAAPKM